MPSPQCQTTRGLQVRRLSHPLITLIYTADTIVTEVLKEALQEDD